ncbi:hypothetical protein [Actinoplanes solisilvae]|nr:hypothetical protein [Actinoplanes solisilvae]
MAELQRSLDRIAGNADVNGFELSSDDMTVLDGLDRTRRSDRALERPWW